jgi:EAL domain-containing protein (putative c-di-GMP-specific phosphodiesterase class I)
VAVTAAERAALRARIEDVLADPGRHLVTVFQPIVGLQDGVIVGAEALARFPGEPIRPPDQWFAAAFEVGLGLELELLAVRLGLAGLGSIAAGYVSVNVSPSTLVSPQFAAVLRDSRAPAHRVVLELTEHVEVAEYDDLRDAVNALRQRGFRLAVDDAGAGYASFQHILELRPDFIKLDRTIVRGVATDPARRALATAVADFAADIGAAVVAEGVEEPDEVIALRAAGVTCGQGYFFARPGPLPLPEVAALPTSVGGRVVIVDDDPVVRLLVASMARRAGLDVVGQASDGEEGAALVSAMRPDVVVLDLSMPVLDGAAALPRVRELVPRASIIVLSSRADPDTAEAAILRGADSFVAKSESATLLPRLFEQLRRPVAGSVG